MELIANNPYREAGILSNASEKELTRQKGKITAYLKVGKTVNSDLDFNFLQKIIRTEDSTKAAFSKIEQSKDRVFHSLFWFLEVNSFDTIALGYLKEGNVIKAAAIWEKVTSGKQISDLNYSSFSNLGTLKLLGDSEIETQKGIEAKIKLIKSPSFKDYAHAVADETFTINRNSQIEQFIDAVFDEFKAHYQAEKIAELFLNCNGTSWEYATKRSTQEPISYLETKIDSTNSRRSKNRIKAYEYGLRLYADCQQELSSLRSILGDQDLKYKMIADKLANEIMQCGVDYFNESHKNDSSDNYLESAQELSKLADSIAVGKLAKDRAKDSLATLAEMKDQEILQAFDILKSVKSAFDSNEAKITSEVLAMPLGYNQTINWTKVNQMIKNSLDWDKVVELVLQTITHDNVEKIRLMDDTAKQSEYKSLVDFLIGKLSYGQINKVKYLAYWRAEDTISNVQFTAKSLPAWAKWAVGFAVLLIIVGLIWGEEGIGTIFSLAISLAGLIGLGVVVDRLRNL